MRDVELYCPSLEELFFRQQLLNDSKTMEYNAGYNVDYYGYNYNSGQIDFPKTKWEEWYNKHINNTSFFYAYIKDVALDKFVGEVNFSKNGDFASMGIVIKYEFRGKGYMRPTLDKLILKAREMGVKFLTDTIPYTRENALRVFYDYGFKVKEDEILKKFNKEEKVAKIVLEL